jgi:2-polyprenyl-6-methoxyphenol hydroxylase-like FAD-dependent oxidoreductase
MSKFRVVIVGGSVAGLTLANILERYKIDYIVVEKHATIAPQLGASIATFPHGARILDQLGLFSSVEDVSMPVYDNENFGPGGIALGPTQPLGDFLEELSVQQPERPVLSDGTDKLEQARLSNAIYGSTAVTSSSIRRHSASIQDINEQ